MKKISKKIKILSAARLLLQIVFFVALPTLYISAFGAIRDIAAALFTLDFSAGLLPQVLEVLAVIPVTVLFGRFFCGWMCAFGAYGDLITRISNKLFKKKRKIGEKVDASLKYVKYAVLGVIILVEWILKSTVFDSASPWDVFGMIATVGKAPDFAYVLTSLTAGLVIFTAITAASVFVERFFCRYLCPLGALFAIASALRISKIRKPSAGCGKCRVCTDACAMGIPLYKTETVKTGECFNCMKCISACPRGNTSFSVAGSDVRPLLASVAAVGVITGTYYTNCYTMSAAASNSVSAVQTVTAEADTAETAAEAGSTAAVTEETSAAAGQYTDGTYHGSGTGFRGGTTTVTVVVSGGKITEITVDSYEDDGPFFSRAYPAVTAEIIAAQSTDVDAVSGATYSSNGIMQAVADALGI